MALVFQTFATFEYSADLNREMKLLNQNLQKLKAKEKKQIALPTIENQRTTENRRIRGEKEIQTTDLFEKYGTIKKNAQPKKNLISTSNKKKKRKRLNRKR